MTHIPSINHSGSGVSLLTSVFRASGIPLCVVDSVFIQYFVIFSIPGELTFFLLRILELTSFSSMVTVSSTGVFIVDAIASFTVFIHSESVLIAFSFSHIGLQNSLKSFTVKLAVSTVTACYCSLSVYFGLCCLVQTLLSP